MSAEVKKWIPGIVIAVIALYALMRLRGSGGGNSAIYNALVPSGGGGLPDSRDPARVSAYSTLASVGLGQMSLAEKTREFDASLSLARDRFGYQLQALDKQNEGLFQRLQAELADRQYDRELQQRAIDQSFALAQSGQLGQQAGSILSALLNALGRGQQQRSSGGGSSGGGAGFPGQQTQRRTIGQMSREAYERLRRAATLQAIFDSPDPTGSGNQYLGLFDPQDYLGFSDPGGFWDNYSRSGDSYDPIGTVTASYYLEDPLSFFPGGIPQYDRSLPVISEDQLSWEDWYSNFGWMYDDYS